MTDNFIDPETVLGNAKSHTWKYFKFRVSGDDIDQSCLLCLGGRPPEEREGARENRDGVAEVCSRECHQ